MVQQQGETEYDNMNVSTNYAKRERILKTLLVDFLAMSTNDTFFAIKFQMEAH